MKRFSLIGIFVTSFALFGQGDTGAITGRVLGMDGRPAVGVRVALASANANGTITSEILTGLTLTDETGHYRIDIPPGRYGVVAGAVAAPTFYPGAASASGASLLTVQRGLETTVPDFALRTPATPLPGSQTNIDPAIRAQAIADLRRQLNLPGQMISGRVVVEGPLVSTFLPNLKIGFMRVVGAFAGSPFPAIGGRSSTIADVIYSTSINASLDGMFRLELKPMPYWLVVGRADSKPLTGFIVKSITLGTTDLLKEELKVDKPVTGEIIITLQSIPLSSPIKL